MNEIVILYILVIAVLNLGVGFAVATYIGRQYRDRIRANDPWDFDQTHASPTQDSAADETPSETLDEDAVEESADDGTSLDDVRDESNDDSNDQSNDQSIVEALGTSESETPSDEAANERDGLTALESADLEKSIEDTLRELTNESLAEAFGTSERESQSDEATNERGGATVEESTDADTSIEDALNELTDESLAEIRGKIEGEIQSDEAASERGGATVEESVDADTSIEDALNELTDESLTEIRGEIDGEIQSAETADEDDDSTVEESADADTSIEDASEASTDTDAPANPAEQDRESRDERTSVEALRNEVAQYHDRLKQADSSLRDDADPLEAAEVKQVLSSLREASETYLTERNRRRDAFEELHRSDPAFDDVRERLQAVTQQQDAQIAGANEIAESLDYEGGLEQGCRRMIQETGKLLDINDRLRDDLDEATLRAAQSENGSRDLDPSLRFDSLTGMRTCAGLEMALIDLWKNDPQRSREICAAMIDFDHFRQINEEHGRAVGDRTLSTVAQAFQSEKLGGGSVWARVAGQQFVLLLPDIDTRAATKAAERLRQTIAHTQFRHRDQEVAVTVSCGVAMATAEDTPGTLLERLRATVNEAKRYGRNRTFVHEGQFPTPVVPPTLALGEKHVLL